MIWAVILACHAATTNFAGLMVVRFLLGLFEASLSPGFSLITSLWYRTSEQPLRHGLWFLGNSISFIIGNIISVGIWEIKSSLANWKVSMVHSYIHTYSHIGLIVAFHHLRHHHLCLGCSDALASP